LFCGLDEGQTKHKTKHKEKPARQYRKKSAPGCIGVIVRAVSWWAALNGVARKGHEELLGLQAQLDRYFSACRRNKIRISLIVIFGLYLLHWQISLCTLDECMDELCHHTVCP